MKFKATTLLAILFFLTNCNPVFSSNNNKNVSIMDQEYKSKTNTYYTENNLEVDIDNGSLLGTLTIPENFTTGSIVLIVAGSGATDRDGNSLKMGIHTDSYKYISHELAKNNIASFRFDKRSLNPNKIKNYNETDLKIEDFINDVVSITKFLKNDKRFNKIILLGHSEGSLLSILSSKIESVSGLISLAGSGKGANEILLEQLKTQVGIDIQELTFLLKQFKDGKFVSDIKNPILKTIFPINKQKYLISWIKYIPKKEIENIDCNVQIIQGTTDIQVSLENALELNKSNKKSKLSIIENMNHVLKDAPIDKVENLKTYSNPNLPLSNKLVPIIIDFVNKLK